jgi:hypothetical protein
MAEHDRMAGRRLDGNIEPESRELVAEPFSRTPHVWLVLGIGADAGDAQQLEQTLARLIFSRIHLTENGINQRGGLNFHDEDS